MKTHRGAREGAGRPKNSLNRRTLLRQKIMEDVAHRMSNMAADASPLDVMLNLGRTALQMGELEFAAEVMTICLPYCHSRKTPVAEKDPNAPTIADIINDTDPEFSDGIRFQEPMQ